MKHVLKNVRLIKDLTEGYMDDIADIVVEGQRIEGIYPPGNEFEQLKTIDFSGKTLLPGMFDLHMHLYFSSSNFNALALQSMDSVTVTINALAYAKEFLRQGFTTIRDCGNQFYVGVAIKRAVKEGIAMGPRILTSGHCITPTTKGNETFPGLYVEANSPDEILHACRKDVSAGVDFLKYMVTGAVANAAGEPGALITTDYELTAMQAAAQSLGTYVGAHCHGKKGILLCIEKGIKTIEHASDIDEECTDLVMKKGNRTAIIPTLGPIALMEAGVLSEHISNKIKKVKPSKEIHPMVAASRAGVLTGWGTDISMDFFVENPGCEFLLRERRGYSNIEILKQATINSAKIVGLDADLGTIKAGKIADFVVVEGNPDEDINVMQQLPCAVYKEGERVF